MGARGITLSINFTMSVVQQRGVGTYMSHTTCASLTTVGKYPTYTLSRRSVLLEHIDRAVLPGLTFIIRPTLLPSSSHYHHPPLPHPCNPFCPTETTSHYCFLARGLAGEGTSWKGREVGAIACGRELLDIHEIVGGSPICD